ncbi:MAG: aminoacyl-tRNA hydrolase [Rickettsiales bacterium]
MTKLLVGLGNPGDKYKLNRHNVGFMVIDAIAAHFGVTVSQSKFHAHYTAAEFMRKKVLLLKPQTYMNLSGEAVQECAHFFKIEPKDIIVFYDEIDLECGRIKVKVGGSHNGHNGVKSLDSHLGLNYTRVRFGVDRPEFGDAADYVLANFSQAQVMKVEEVTRSIVDHLKLLLDDKLSEFMNKCALDFKQEEKI